MMEDVMFTRSMMLVCALGFAGYAATSEAANDPAGAASQDSGKGGGFGCQNNSVISGVTCVGSIAVLPINIDIKNVGVLDNSDLSVLSDDLNKVSILDGGILNGNKILNDAELTVLDDFLNKFVINVTKNDVDVCTTVLGVLLCH
jgi:hypothetical protein